MPEFVMPEPPEGHFLRVKMTRIFSVPIVKVQLRKQMRFGSVLISWYFSYIDGEEEPKESVQEKVTRLATKLVKEYTEVRTAYERASWASDMEGDYRG